MILSIVVAFICLQHLIIIAVSGQGTVCTSDNQCTILQQCINGICQESNQGCPTECGPQQVCLAPYCYDVPQPTADVYPPQQFPPQNDDPYPQLPRQNDDPYPQLPRQSAPALPPADEPAATLPPTPPPTTTAAPATCGAGWTFYNGYCYYVGGGQTTYGDATSFCTLSNAQVVWFDQTQFSNYVAEARFVNQLAISSGVRTYWIGLQKLYGQWMWTNSQPVRFTNWRPSQPDGCCGSDVACVLVNYGGTSGQWDDAGCTNARWTNPQGFVCKKKA